MNGNNYKFIMNNETWEIKEMTQKEIKEKINSRKGEEPKIDINNLESRYYGSSFMDECLLVIDKDLSMDRKKKTLLHELTHCYINAYITHLEKEYSEEDVADIFSNAYNIIENIYNNYLEVKND